MERLLGCRHLPPYKVSDWQWAIAHVLAITGGLAGIFMGHAYLFEGYLTSALGFPYWEVRHHSSCQ